MKTFADSKFLDVGSLGRRSRNRLFLKEGNIRP